jgi:hypothetical protein
MIKLSQETELRGRLPSKGIEAAMTAINEHVTRHRLLK